MPGVPLLDGRGCLRFYVPCCLPSALSVHRVDTSVDLCLSCVSHNELCDECGGLCIRIGSYLVITSFHYNVNLFCFFCSRFSFSFCIFNTFWVFLCSMLFTCERLFCSHTSCQMGWESFWLSETKLPSWAYAICIRVAIARSIKMSPWAFSPIILGLFSPVISHSLNRIVLNFVRFFYTCHFVTQKAVSLSRVYEKYVLINCLVSGDRSLV